MDEYTDIRQIIEPAAGNLGFEIVRLKWIGDTLQIMIDQHNGATITVDDCEKVSHTVSALLDVEDIIDKAYRLEVSSPGIDRPLTRLKDFENWQGFETKIDTREPVEGRKKFKGTVTRVGEEDIDFKLKGEETVFTIPYAKIHEAKLVLNDELVKHVTKNSAGKQGYVEGNEVEIK